VHFATQHQLMENSGGMKYHIFPSSQIYNPPSWLAGKIKNIPTHKLNLGNFPTPIQQWKFEVDGKKHQLLIKRDDFSESAASGNKIRKLEFIFAEILRDASYDSVLSIGGTQSNHCRAVSVVAARLGLPSSHILRKDAYFDENQPLAGNLLFHHLYGSKIFYVTKDEYSRKGQAQLLKEVQQNLIDTGTFKKPYIIPVGGSNSEGVFGYVEFIHELEKQINENPNIYFDEIIFSCGSGGTATGLVIGHLFCDSPMIKNAKLIGYTSCDTPDLFHRHVNEMLDIFGIKTRSEECVTFIQSKGLGYALNTEREIDVILQVAKSSGIILDTSYTGKAIAEFVKEGRPDGVISLFIHTGGLYSVFGKPELFQNKK